MKAKRSAEEAGLSPSTDALKVNKIEESKDEIFIA